MALTITALGVGPQHVGQQKHTPVTLVPDSSYLTNGESVRVVGSPISASETILGIQWIGGNAAAGGVHPHYDVENEKVLFYRSLAGDKREYAPGAGDIKGATNLAGTEGNADQNAAPVNSGLYAAAATVASLAGTITPTVQPAIPRNVVITVTNDSGGALNLFEGTTTFTITGTDYNGDALTETVTLVSTSGNKSVANSKFRFVQSSKAFRTITSVTYTNAPASTLKLSLGPGTRFGLPVALMSASHTHVKVISTNAAPATISATATSAGGVDTTNNTVNVGTIADGDDVFIAYKAAAEQVASTDDLSALSFRAVIITT